MLALKTKCLTKAVDKNRVANELTLSGCWEKLDDEYGDIDTLVAEIFSNWGNLKPPTSDAQFIKFVESIEYGVSTLTALGHEKEMDSSYSSVMLEKKLNTRLQQEFSKSFTSEDKSSKNRMRSLMKFLQSEKKAAHLRTCNYSTTSPVINDEDDDNSVSASATGVTNRGRGDDGWRGGQGRGKGGRGGQNKSGTSFRGRGGQGHQNSQKRGEPSTKCNLCSGDHATSKCPNWRDKKNVKAELLGLAISLPKPFCMWCLEPGHPTRQCQNQEDYGCPCDSGFNIFLCCKTDDCKTRKNWTETHSSTTAISSSLTLVNGVKMGETLLPMQMIPVTDKEVVIRVMFDNCSQSTFILTKTAKKKLNLKGIPISYILVCTDGTRKKMTGLLFKLQIKDIAGNFHEIEAVGLDTISSIYPGVKVTNIRTMVEKFSMCNSVTDEKLARNAGELDLLIGSDLAHLHPKGVVDVGKMTLMRSKFATGWTLMGHDKDLIQLTSNQTGIRVNACAVEKIEVAELFEKQNASHISGIKDLQFLDRVSAGNIDDSVPPKCTSCQAKPKNCKEYKMQTEMIFENNLEERPDDIKLLNKSLFDSFKCGVTKCFKPFNLTLVKKQLEQLSQLLKIAVLKKTLKSAPKSPKTSQMIA